jgi:hypothetical protein
VTKTGNRVFSLVKGEVEMLCRIKSIGISGRESFLEVFGAGGEVLLRVL